MRAVVRPRSPAAPTLASDWMTSCRTPASLSSTLSPGPQGTAGSLRRPKTRAASSRASCDESRRRTTRASALTLPWSSQIAERRHGVIAQTSWGSLSTGMLCAAASTGSASLMRNMASRRRLAQQGSLFCFKPLQLFEVAGCSDVRKSPAPRSAPGPVHRRYSPLRGRARHRWAHPAQPARWPPAAAWPGSVCAPYRARDLAPPFANARQRRCQSQLLIAVGGVI